MDDSSPWGPDGLLPLELALRIGLPAQRCYLYRVDAGGDIYIGMTTLDPEAAMADHVEQARSGEQSKLHKALRRFGYSFDLSTISEHATEVDCLVAKVSQVQRLRPTLNSTFGGEGNLFNLIELPNKLGEQVLYVENKRARQSLMRNRRKSDFRYLKSVFHRIRLRYDKFELNLPHERTRYADELWAVPVPSSFDESGPVAAFWRFMLYSPDKSRDIAPKALATLKESLTHYRQMRSKRLALLRDWTDETRKAVDEHHRFANFLNVHGLALLTSARRMMSDERSYEGTAFNPAYFKGIKRVFLFGRSSAPTQVFADDQIAKEWLVQQHWYRYAIDIGFVKTGDAFFPLRIYAGRYGGFLGVATKVNYRVGYVGVD